MKKDGKLNYTHYVTLWKAILLTKLLATIKDSEIGFFNGHIIGNIRSLLNSYNFTKITMDSFSPVSFMDNIKFASGVSGKIGNDLATTEGNLSTETITQKTVEQYVYEDNWLAFINRIADELSRLRLKIITICLSMELILVPVISRMRSIRSVYTLSLELYMI